MNSSLESARIVLPTKRNKTEGSLQRQSWDIQVVFVGDSMSNYSGSKCEKAACWSYNDRRTQGLAWTKHSNSAEPQHHDPTSQGSLSAKMRKFLDKEFNRFCLGTRGCFLKPFRTSCEWTFPITCVSWVCYGLGIFLTDLNRGTHELPAQ